jgi:hypothetical protein
MASIRCPALACAAVTAIALLAPASGARVGGRGACQARGTLGRLAFVKGGALELLDLGTCGVRELVPVGARAPVRFSADGRWVGFGAAAVAPLAGGRVERPLGHAISTGDQDRTWAWAPAGATLAGATRAGGVLVGAPGRVARRLEPDGWGAADVRFAAQRTLLVTRAGTPRRSAQLWRFVLHGGRGRIVFRAPAPTASLQLAGSAAGWALVWRNAIGSASLAADGLPLLAIPPGGGRSVRLARAVLVEGDFVVPCGRGVAVVAGAGRESTLGKRLRLLEPPAWRPRELGPGIAPSCSRGGRAVAFARGPQRHERAFGDERRAIWLARAGRRPRALTDEPPPGTSDERPLLAPDGRNVLWVRSGPTRPDASAPGALFAGRAGGPLAQLGRTGNYYGTYGWSLQLDWTR